MSSDSVDRGNDNEGARAPESIVTEVRRLLFVLLAGCAVSGLTGCGDTATSPVDPDGLEGIGLAKRGEPTADHDPGAELHPIRFTDDPAVFFAEAGELQAVTFETLPWFGTSCNAAPPFEPLANPLIVGEVEFEAPGCIESFLCPRPPCETVNTTLHLPRRARMNLPEGVTGVLLKLEGMPAGLVALAVEDGEGALVGYSATLFEALPAYVGIRTDRGIRSVRYYGSSSFLQKLVVSDLWYEGEAAAGELRAERSGPLASRSAQVR